MGFGKGRGYGRGRAILEDVDDSTVGAGMCCCFLIFMAAGIMVGCSFQILTPMEAGIAFNTVSKSIDSGKVYTSGRYFLGLARSFIVFPSTYQNIEFSSGSKSDGAPLRVQGNNGTITIEASMQYRLRLEHLVDLYKRHETKYHDKFVRSAQSAIQKEAATIPATDYFSNREGVSSKLFDAVKVEFDREQIDLMDFQLRRVDLPSQVDVNILNQIVAREGARAELNVREQEGIRGNISVVTTEAQTEIAVVNADFSQRSNVIAAEAEANASRLLLFSEADALVPLRTELNFSNDEILRYQYIGHLRTTTASSTKLVGFDRS